MKIERDETKTEKLSLKLRAYKDSAVKDKECYITEGDRSDDVARLYALAQGIFEDVEMLESVGMDHLDAMLIAMMNCKRKQITGANVFNPLTR